MSLTRATTVALFGGSFDPPHLAHQMMCLYALSAVPVDEVWMLPTFVHAFGKALAPFDERVRMCELAAAAFGGRVVVSRVEEEVARARGAESRTYHTLVHLAAAHPGVRWRLLVGEDILAETDSWHRWGDVVRMAPSIVVGREGAGSGSNEPAVRLPPIASRDLRARIAAGERPVGLVPLAVLDHIAAHGLYR